MKQLKIEEIQSMSDLYKSELKQGIVQNYAILRPEGNQR